MPTFVVVVQGTGIKVPSLPDPIIGFFATRRVMAADEASAIEEAKRLILDEWHSGGYETENIGNAPSLRVYRSWPQGLLQRVFSRVPNRGYTFY